MRYPPACGRQGRNLFKNIRTPAFSSPFRAGVKMKKRYQSQSLGRGKTKNRTVPPQTSSRAMSSCPDGYREESKESRRKGWGKNEKAVPN